MMKRKTLLKYLNILKILIKRLFLSILLKEVSETIQTEAKNKKEDFLVCY